MGAAALVLFAASTGASAQDVVMRRPLPADKASGPQNCDTTHTCQVTCDATSSCVVKVPCDPTKDVCDPVDPTDPTSPTNPVDPQKTITYKFEMGSFGDYTGDCTFDRQRTASASCTKEGQPTAMSDCLQRGMFQPAGSWAIDTSDPTQTSATVTDHEGAWFAGCPMRWKYSYGGFEGYNDPVAGVQVQPENQDTYCQADSCGQQVSYYYYPAHCYVTLPNGADAPVFPGPGLTPPAGYDPSKYGGYGGDDYCIARDMPRPAPERSNETLIRCTGYGVNGGDSGSGMACTGDVIGSFAMPYDGDPSVPRSYCSSMEADCCTWRADPNENAPDGHKRYWHIEAHRGSAWTSVGGSTFSWRSELDGSDFSGTPKPYDQKEIADASSDHSCLPHKTFVDTPGTGLVNVTNPKTNTTQCAWFLYNDPVPMLFSIPGVCIGKAYIDGPPNPDDDPDWWKNPPQVDGSMLDPGWLQSASHI